MWQWGILRNEKLYGRAERFGHLGSFLWFSQSVRNISPRGTPIQTGRECSCYLLGLKKCNLIPLGVLTSERSMAGAFAEPFRALSRKKYDRRLCAVFKLMPVRGENHFKPHPQKRFLVPLGVLFKISDEHPCPFLWEFLGEFYRSSLWKVQWSLEDYYNSMTMTVKSWFLLRIRWKII